MVKLIFNPKTETTLNLNLTSRTSKKNRLTDIVKVTSSKNLNPFSLIENESLPGGELQPNGQLNFNITGLENCHYILKEWFYKNEEKNLLIIGPTGCGKTTLVDFFCRQENIELLNINIKSNENRTKRDVLKDIEIFMKNNVLTQFFTTKSQNLEKKLLLIDEYQNGQNDTLTITDILELKEKKIKIKILIISSDSRGSKLTDLKKSCEVYYINEIPGYLIKKWILTLQTGLTQQQIDSITLKCGSDKRLILNTVEFLKNSKNGNVETFLENYYKDTDLNTFEFVKELFDASYDCYSTKLKKIFKTYEADGYLLANLVHENYLDYDQDIHNVARAADAISYGELLYSDTYDSNKSFLPELHCLHSIVIPSYCVKRDHNYKLQPRSSIINNRFNILLNNKKIIDKINKTHKNGLDIFDIYIIKALLTQELVKAKTVLPLKIEFVKNILKHLDNEIDRLELIYKHFNDFRPITGREVKTKNFTLKFKEKISI